MFAAVDLGPCGTSEAGDCRSRPGRIKAVKPTFSVREDGQVDVQLGSEWPTFNKALNDCVSSLPPRGVSGSGPSTYWIDVAERGVQSARLNGNDRPFIWEKPPKSACAMTQSWRPSTLMTTTNPVRSCQVPTSWRS